MAEQEIQEYEAFVKQNLDEVLTLVKPEGIIKVFQGSKKRIK
ncbi:hypothetical protein [Bacteroides caccae]|jgi:hypothetical protein|nr:hypothetical protein [Bacteroides caccae]